MIREGQLGTAFYFVATGEVRVYRARRQQQGGRARRACMKASLFGEMALVTEQARTASVQVVGEADLLEVDRAAHGARSSPRSRRWPPRLDKFARERLLKNLLATSPLFKPFNHQQQMELLKRFEGHDVAPGTVVIREGDVGQGLFVVLSGEVEILEQGRRRPRADSLAQAAAPATSSARCRCSAIGRRSRPCARCRGRRSCSWAATTSGGLVQALPPLRQYFEELSKQADARARLAHRPT